jgi:hypothetical protein
MDKEKIYISLSNGDFNDVTTIDDMELIRWELNEGCQDFVVITKEPITPEDYERVSEILGKYN